MDDRVQGLCAGGEDYLAKPFAFSELLARVEVLARRPAAAASEGSASELRAGDIVIDLHKRTCVRQGKPVDLNPKEFFLFGGLFAVQKTCSDSDNASGKGVGHEF